MPTTPTQTLARAPMLTLTLAKLSFFSCLASCVASLFCSQCTTPDTAVPLGIQAGYESYIPARIAVMPAQDWPLRARFHHTLPSKLSEAEKKPLFEAIDAFVLQSFADQPFIKGYTPNVMAQLLERSNQKHLLTELPQLWAFDLSQCSACSGAATTYAKAIAELPAWRLWLHAFSKAANYADALLLPLVVEAYEYQYRDRGLFVSERVANLALLLIDTNNGNLLWAGSRKATAVEQGLDSAEATFPAYPPWALVMERLLHKDLWKEFPGRLTES